MFSFFNRFIDWFLMREEDPEAALLQGPAQITHGVSDVNVLLCEPTGKFANPEAKEALLQGLLEPLNAREGITIRTHKKSFQRGNRGGLTEQFQEVVEKGRDLLEQETCDLLMWGNVEIEAQSVRWYFLSAQEMTPNLGVPGMVESIVVPFVPESPIMDVLYATIFAATAPTHPSHAAKIGECLLGAVEPLTKLPAGLTARKTPPLAKTSTMGMCAVVLSNIARRGEELGWFEPAIKAYEVWEELIDKDKNLIDWALVKNHQGWLYEVMSGRDEDDKAEEHISKAIEIFEDVCSVFTQQAHPMEWASVQLRIADTCARTGRTYSEPDFLQKSARYYKRSLEVYNQQTYPLNWADVMSRMARALMLHGQMVKGAQSLEQAGVAFQAILKVYTDDKYPAQWASTQNNLGATLFALAKRDPSTPEWLNHALMCFQAARNYYSHIEKTQMVHVIDKNIKKATELRDDIQERLDNDLLN